MLGADIVVGAGAEEARAVASLACSALISLCAFSKAVSSVFFSDFTASICVLSVVTWLRRAELSELRSPRAETVARSVAMSASAAATN